MQPTCTCECIWLKTLIIESRHTSKHSCEAKQKGSYSAVASSRETTQIIYLTTPFYHDLLSRVLVTPREPQLPCHLTTWLNRLLARTASSSASPLKGAPRTVIPCSAATHLLHLFPQGLAPQLRLRSTPGLLRGEGKCGHVHTSAGAQPETTVVCDQAAPSSASHPKRQGSAPPGGAAPAEGRQALDAWLAGRLAPHFPLASHAKGDGDPYHMRT